MEIWTILAAVGLPSVLVAAVVGLVFRRIEKRMDRQEEEREVQEAERREYEKVQLRVLTGIMGLCEANAIALQNGKCNGETHAALDHMQEVKHELRDFLTSQGIDHIFLKARK